ncbi:hypothetical protein KBX71_01160 [Micromonospora sp. D93]|uniref:hypothetical protein n=1 Tax=Micromonospora sp. D93 TaxID=2824886 RepID=UPI001B369A27|nr:hypothetical protein [Micromonospora sp. D93]MBQ1016472.1 hypothetical protein [Micromonospora sp. D93]
MDMADWFWYDEPLAPHLAAFVAILRRRATLWPGDPGDTYLRVPDANDVAEVAAWDADGHELLAWMDIVDDAEGRVLLSLGAYLGGERVRGDEIHNQTLDLPKKPTELAFEAAGTVEECAEATASWIETQLRRPIVRQEWLRDGIVQARRWRYADTGIELSRLGFRTGDEPPDRTIHVRGD